MVKQYMLGQLDVIFKCGLSTVPHGARKRICCAQELVANHLGIIDLFSCLVIMHVKTNDGTPTFQVP